MFINLNFINNSIQNHITNLFNSFKLYKKGFSAPSLLSLDKDRGIYTLEEVTPASTETIQVQELWHIEY